MKSFKAILKTVLRVALLVYVGLMIFGQYFSGPMIYPHPPSSYTSLPGRTSFPGLVWITSADGKHLAGDWRPRFSSRWTILYLHGNGEDLGEDQSQLDYIGSLGASVLSYDYRGYGLSEGTPNESNLLRDVLAVYGYLVGPLHVDPRTIVVWGRSLGSGSATYLASQRPVAGLILESAYTSLFRIVVPQVWFPNDQFCSLSRMHSVNCPVLIMHGTSDEVVPFWMGKKLYEAAKGPKSHLWVDRAGHNDLMDVAGPRYTAAVRDFLSRINAPATVGSAVSTSRTSLSGHRPTMAISGAG